jgi:membrane protein implicated in regulation of membrane protease activity
LSGPGALLSSLAIEEPEAGALAGGNAMTMNWNWVLVVAGAVLVLVEVLLGGFTGFDLALLGSSLVLGGIAGLALHSAAAGFIAASILCIGYIAAGRRWVRGRLKRAQVPTNTDAVVGQRALVVRTIATHVPGQVRVRDEVWRARPASGSTGPFEAGAEVTVEGVDGVTLLVRGASS